MALRGIQKYIAGDANNIARVEDDNDIIALLVTKRVESTILFWPLKSHIWIMIIIIHID